MESNSVYGPKLPAEERLKKRLCQSIDTVKVLWTLFHNSLQGEQRAAFTDRG